MSGDSAFLFALRGGAVLAGGVLVLMVGFLLLEAWPALAALGPQRFATDPSWHPAPDAGGRFNLSPMLAGTLLSTLGAMLLAAPVALASAAMLQVYAPRRVAALYRRLLELLAGIPSVVYGFWGLVVLVPLIRGWAPPGASLLTASLILALMILPTAALFADAAIAAVPAAQRRAAAALGFTRSRMLLGVLLPTARGGILAGLVLATGRALGETMALLMVAGNVVQLPASIFDPVRTLTANIALEMAYATELHQSALFVSGLLLALLVMGLVLLAERLTRGQLRV